MYLTESGNVTPGFKIKLFNVTTPIRDAVIFVLLQLQAVNNKVNAIIRFIRGSKKLKLKMRTAYYSSILR